MVLPRGRTDRIHIRQQLGTFLLFQCLCVYSILNVDSYGGRIRTFIYQIILQPFRLLHSINRFAQIDF